MPPGQTSTVTLRLPYTLYMTLGQLIAAYRGDVSYERLARRAEKHGYDISATMIHVLATKPLTNIPRVETIHAIAAALGIEPREVLDAAAESVGLIAQASDTLQPVTNREQVEALLAVVRHRPPEQVEHLSRVIRTVAAALDDQPDGSD